MRAGFVGLGRIGRPMAQRIIERNYPLTVTDIEPQNAATLIDRGARFVATAADVIPQADVIVTCLPGPQEVEEVYLGTGGLLAADCRETLFVETSTIDPALSRRIAERCYECGAHYIDAPISGGTESAARGTLCVMAGGTAQALERARPVLECFADTIVHVGSAGTGHLVKLLNQAIYLGYVALFCEATSVADANGVARPDLLRVLRQSVAAHPLATHWEERLETGDIAPGFAINRVLKDLRLAAGAYDDANITGAAFRAALAAFESASAQGHAAHDMTTIFAGANVM